MTPTTPADLAELERLLVKATPQKIETAEQTEDGDYECPLCQTQGYVEGHTYCNYDGVAIGVQFFGIGDEHVDAEALFRKTIAALPSLLATGRQMPALEAEVERLRAELDRRNLDGDTSPAYADEVALPAPAQAEPVALPDSDDR